MYELKVSTSGQTLGLTLRRITVTGKYLSTFPQFSPAQPCPASQINYECMPGIQAASSEAKKAAAKAISSGLPSLFKRIRLSVVFFASSFIRSERYVPSTNPGKMAFTVILYVPNTREALFVSPMMPAFEEA